MKETVVHPWGPLYNADSRVLILGTMPSPRSRREGFYYAHPQNRFWPVMGRVLGEEIPVERQKAAELLLRRHIALWDVLRSCVIRGADDASIKEAVPNDIGGLVRQCPIKAIFTTGQKAADLYRRFFEKETGVRAIPLPSTSPAACGRFTFEDLVLAYRAILPYLEEE